jgi:hypothetical protein
LPPKKSVYEAEAPKIEDDLLAEVGGSVVIKTSVAIVFGTNQIRTIKEMGKKDGLKQTKIELDIGGRCFSIFDDQETNSGLYLLVDNLP